ncbi:hypothetical protein BC830DRAFT_1084498 [Chytriomyces sp. MP71]|nr:hypothetical protein BC830DRAFT_1084498 [Chytriomyces sp. MP71]
MSHRQINVVETGCPPPKAALIGILSVPNYSPTARRALTRRKYQSINKNLSREFQIDIIYVFGRQNSTSPLTHLLEWEFSQHPDDTIILELPESRDDGKVLDWFRLARNLSYLPHPTQPNSWCQKYLYVGKSDDDALIHIERLSKELVGLRRNESQFIGRIFRENQYVPHMTGMLYLLSINLVEWLSSTELRLEENRRPEDLQMGIWFWKNQLNISWISYDSEFHNLPSGNYAQEFMTNESVLVHWCKNSSQFADCFRLFERFGMSGFQNKSKIVF